MQGVPFLVPATTRVPQRREHSLDSLKHDSTTGIEGSLSAEALWAFARFHPRIGELVVCPEPHFLSGQKQSKCVWQ